MRSSRSAGGGRVGRPCMPKDTRGEHCPARIGRDLAGRRPGIREPGAGAADSASGSGVGSFQPVSRSTPTGLRDAWPISWPFGCKTIGLRSPAVAARQHNTPFSPDDYRDHRRRCCALTCFSWGRAARLTPCGNWRTALPGTVSSRATGVAATLAFASGGHLDQCVRAAVYGSTRPGMICTGSQVWICSARTA